MALFDKDHRILITRRNINMKLFPHAWVFPGGHIDLGESLEHGVIRELKEETGVTIEIIKKDNEKEVYYHNGEECILEPFYVFESVSWKVFDSNTPPNSGHLIIFFRIKLNKSADEIDLLLEPEEVDGAVWLNRDNI
jgi:8-oxo-dGTP pyrophosphatase MutT (NUDIX family)